MYGGMWFLPVRPKDSVRQCLGSRCQYPPGLHCSGFVTVRQPVQAHTDPYYLVLTKDHIHGLLEFGEQGAFIISSMHKWCNCPPKACVKLLTSDLS